MSSCVLSTVTITAIGLTCKAFLKLGFCSVEISGLSILLNALRSERRNNGQGVITVANHISTLDDPVMWGILPAGHYLRSQKMRWALGASDIMFTNPVLSAFFRHGQVLETFRGKGIYQPVVDVAIAKLNHGAWVHLFSEGKVNQPKDYHHSNGIAHLPRFKWGIGRILMETNVPPIVIPMWLSGFNHLMPEGRRFPYKYFPRLGANLSVTVGSPIPPDDFKCVLQSRLDSNLSTIHDRDRLQHGWMDEARTRHLIGEGTTSEREIEDVGRIRSDATAVIHRAVEALGRKMSGNSLASDDKDRRGWNPHRH